MKKRENVKVGETYYVRTKVLSVELGYTDTEIAAVVVDAEGKALGPDVIYFDKRDLAAFSSCKPETAPKYDPCRRFRKGDLAELSRYKGRAIIPIDLKVGDKVKVCENEKTDSTIIHVIDPIGRRYFINPAYLELVTPVEELVRYIIIHNENNKYYEVCWKDDDEPDGRTGRTRCRTTFWYHQPPQTYSQKEAKAAAEAERDRLIAEYRKESE